MNSASKCRHCKTRNRPGTPMYYVGWSLGSRSAYYCPDCYNLFEDLALAETPDLFRDGVNEDAAAVQLDSLLKLTKPQGRRLYRHGNGGRAPSLVMMFPTALIIDKLPFKRYYLTGDELARHAAEVRQKMCVEEPVDDA